MKRLLEDLLLFKIAEIRVAQPGLYPILKPREIRQWWKATQPGVLLDDPDVAFEAFLQNANTPWIRPDLAFVPSPPFTMVGFNVTTEVFLAPATERLNVSVVPSPPSKEPADQTSDIGLKQIKDRLLQAASASSIESIKALTEGLIAIRPDDQGLGTVIELQSLPSVQGRGPTGSPSLDPRRPGINR